MAEILKAADVSASSFQHLFRSKDGPLTELTMMVFQNQFGAARSLVTGDTSPAQLYALETALQLTMTELNESLRDVYVEAYTYPDTCEFIVNRTAVELRRCFSSYLPNLGESDFYEMDLGTNGMMRSYMARKCVYHVPPEEREEILAYVESQDIRSAAKQALNRLFESLAISNPLEQPLEGKA